MASAADHPEGNSAVRTGAELRTARQRLGWDLADVAAGLRIRLAYLEALEDGCIADLPGNAYAVGFLRTYASALGLDPEEMTRRFRAEAAEVNRKTELTFPAPVPERGVPAGAVILLGVLLAIGGYVGWYRISGSGARQADAIPDVPAKLAPLAENATPGSMQSPQVASLQPSPDQAGPAALDAGPPAAPKPTASAQPGTPAILAPQRPPGQVASAETPQDSTDAADAAGQRVVLPPPAGSALSPAAATPPPAPAGPRLVLRATADAWVQVRQKQGAVLLNRILRAGETWPVPDDKPDLVLTTGNAGGTELVVDGVATPPLGSSGAVRRDLPLDPDLIKSGALGPKGTVQPVSAGAAPPASTQRLQAQ